MAIFRLLGENLKKRTFYFLLPISVPVNPNSISIDWTELYLNPGFYHEITQPDEKSFGKKEWS